MGDALDGILVIALEQAVAAPVATTRLADAGARVIKIERPEGDFARGYDDYVNGQSTYFVWINRGKESCRIDLKRDEDRALVEAMIAGADVFIQNLAPGATERLGLGSAELRRRYPKLITCDISGYAPGTPHHTRKAYDLLVQAEVGLSAITGDAASGPTRVGLAHPSIAPYGIFALCDGAVVLSIQSEREWHGFCAVVLRDPAIARDPRFRVNVERVRNRAACDGTVQAILGSRSAAEAAADLDRAGIAYGFVSTVGDLMRHPSATALPVETPNGTVDVLAPPVIVDGERPHLKPVPALGQHDAALRAEFGSRGAQEPT